ncbi:MAG: hypothetical protein CMF96_09670 [Candidatus Marinimicrobia bacterium]|nr:hypothetical protein [Candidatus Neomarinimicrobiota bacterium]|tara:strand:- start:6207 stop:6482 length:276 start_codon:yes stop_codon:yes gene_type:complete
MASPSDIPKIQSNLNLNQSIATESSKIDKDCKEHSHEQSDHPKDENEKDSIELSQQAKEKLESQNIPQYKKSNDVYEDDEDAPGLNIDFKV